MEKIIEALGKLLPEDQVSEVSKAVEEMLEEKAQVIHQEASEKLDEAYAELSQELKEAEQTAEVGYGEAHAIIQDLRNRLERQQTEFDSSLEEGYEEAYQMLVSEKGKNDNFEVEIYEEYDKKLSEMKEYIVDKVDAFLQYKGGELYEQARRDVLNDPAMAEHKVALDRIVDTVSEYISDEEYTLATSSKLEEAKKSIEDLKGQHRILEARNIRLSTENNKLGETVRQAETLITEHIQLGEKNEQTEKKERVKKAKNVQGRGQITEGIIPEYDETPKEEDTKEHDTTLVENLDPEVLRQYQVLSGVKKND